jgi:hypothetical protein
VRFLPLSLALLTLALIPETANARTLLEYKHYRALSIDLLGRMPTRDELAAFEKADFDLDRWIDTQLDARGYTDRLTRIWMDTLRLELSNVIQIRPPSTMLRRVMIQGPDGPLYVYFRPGQHRTRDATDGDFCLTKDESGIKVLPNQNKPQQGMPVTVTKAILDANTVLVKPWWLYRDFRSAAPVLHYGTTWTTPDAGFEPAEDLLMEADGKSKTVAVRVCKEEAQAADSGVVSARAKNPWAKQHKGESIACRSGIAHAVSTECGCGTGLERCLPSEGGKKGDTAFVSASRVGLGVDQPFDRVEQSSSEWTKLWLAQEASTYLGRIFREDRDFREVLTGKGTWINGPLAQFYRSSSGSGVGKMKQYGLGDDGDPLFDPGQVPIALLPHDLSTWERVESRGPRGAGILTMPVFLEKYATRRARGAAIYSAFLCKSFVASPNVKLTPSNDPNLMSRPGCSTCHATLEPLAAWFSRVSEGDIRWLPADAMPLENAKCKLDALGKAPGACRDHYDPAFSTKEFGLLRGAYASKSNADVGPIGAGEEIAKSPELASCVVERVTSAFLGRPTGSEDAALLATLREVLTTQGYRMRPLVRALVKSKAYRDANDMENIHLAGSGGGQ